MPRIWRTSGQELAVENAAVCEDAAALKEYLCEVYGFPVYLQQVLQGGSVLANETKLDAQMDLQLVLLTIYGPPPSLNIPRLAATDLVKCCSIESCKHGPLLAGSWC